MEAITVTYASLSRLPAYTSGGRLLELYGKSFHDVRLLILFL